MRPFFARVTRRPTYTALLEGEVELVLVIKDKISKTDVQFKEYARITERQLNVVDSVKASEIFGWSAFLPEGHYVTNIVKPEWRLAILAYFYRETCG